MEIIYFLIGCSVFIAVIFLAAFFWANKTGQHDDTHTPAMRMLFDDDHPIHSKQNESSVNTKSKK
jgi:cbb3-type cytochrome oxidase maturation protein